MHTTLSKHTHTHTLNSLTQIAEKSHNAFTQTILTKNKLTPLIPPTYVNRINNPTLADVTYEC